MMGLLKRITETQRAISSLAAEQAMSQLTQSESGVDLSLDNRIRILNDSGADLARFSIVGIGEPLTDPASNLDAFLERTAFRSTAPTAGGRFAILQDGATQAEIVFAKMSGETACVVYLADPSHVFAAATADEYGYLTSQDRSGSAEIITKGVPEATALAGDIDDATIEIAVEVPSGWPIALGEFVVTIDDEEILVTAVDGGTWTVERGHGGTDAADHDEGAAVAFAAGAVWAYVAIGNDGDPLALALSFNNAISITSTVPNFGFGVQYGAGYVVARSGKQWLALATSINDPPPSSNWEEVAAGSFSKILNLPDASYLIRGLINFDDQNLAGQKTLVNGDTDVLGWASRGHHDTNTIDDWICYFGPISFGPFGEMRTTFGQGGHPLMDARLGYQRANPTAASGHRLVIGTDQNKDAGIAYCKMTRNYFGNPNSFTVPAEGATVAITTTNTSGTPTVGMQVLISSIGVGPNDVCLYGEITAVASSTSITVKVTSIQRGFAGDTQTNGGIYEVVYLDGAFGTDPAGNEIAGGVITKIGTGITSIDGGTW